jgi:ligand-binding sensor domain-containing protein
MWFGTQDGLNRFDGIDFTIYRHSIYDTTSISENWINTIYEDQSGTIWIGTNGGGLNKFDRRSESFESYQYNPQSVHNTIRAILEDHEKVLWVATDHGLYNFDPHLEQFDRFLIDTSAPTIEVIRDIYQDSRGKIWAGLAEGLVTIERAVTDHQSFEVDSSLQVAEYISTIYEDDSGVVWLGTTTNGLIQVDVANRITRLERGEGATLSNSLITAISEDHSGNLWVGTPDGLNIYERKTGRFRIHRSNPLNPKSLSNNSVQDIYKDIAGAMWIGTSGGGICKVDPNRKRFKAFKFGPTAQHFPNQQFIWAFEEDRRGAIWIGTNKGIRIFQEGEYEIELSERVNQALGQYTVRGIAVDRFGTIWLGTRRGGLFGISPKARSYGRLDQTINSPGDSQSISSNWINTIYEDANGVLWVGTFNGLNKLLVSSVGTTGVSGTDSAPRFKRFLHTPNQRSLSSPMVTAIVQDKNSDLWVGTTVGLNKFNPERGDFRRYLHQADGPEVGLSDNYILSLYADSTGVLWVGTAEGLNKLNVDTGENTIYAATNGFPNDVCYGILPDDDGNLWLSTNRGLCRFDPADETFKNYDATDGLQSDEFNAGACLRTMSGGMFFGGINGFNLFIPEQIRDNTFIPPIAITNFSVFDKSVPFDDEISLSHDENFFSFEFAALNFTNPQKNNYAYQLVGFDETWIMSGTRRYASYTNLDPGQYLLRVKGANNDGVWNHEGVSLAITVVPPFWETNWFYGLSLALLASLLLIAHDYRLKARLKKREEHDRIRKTESEKVRRRTAHDFHDEMGHKLTRISVLCEMVKRKSDGSWQRIKDMIDEILKIQIACTEEPRTSFGPLIRKTILFMRSWFD